MIKIVPQKGLKVMNPATMRALPEDGTIVHCMDTYWTRRHADGDIRVEEFKATNPQQKQAEAK